MRFVRKWYHTLRAYIWQHRYYTGISDLPIGIWFKIHESTDGDKLRYLKRNTLLFRSLFMLMILPLLYFSVWLAVAWVVAGLLYRERPDLVWEQIYNQFIKKIGLNKEYTEYLELTKHIAMMQCEWVIEPNPVLKVQIQQSLIDLKERQADKKVKYSEIIANVSKANGFRIDPMSVSVEEFYSYIPR